VPTHRQSSKSFGAIAQWDPIHQSVLRVQNCWDSTSRHIRHKCQNSGGCDTGSITPLAAFRRLRTCGREAVVPAKRQAVTCGSTDCDECESRQHHHSKSIVGSTVTTLVVKIVHHESATTTDCRCFNVGIVISKKATTHSNLFCWHCYVTGNLRGCVFVL
jgi:hypothetical protein